jgi:outer membrane protein assembly factor BamB
MFQRLVASAAIAIAAVATVSADNWPTWRGPSQNGNSSEKNLPLKWSTAEGVTWKLALPTLSGSTPIIWGDSIFLSVAEGAAEGDPLSLWCVNRADGAVRWKQPMDTGNHKVRKGDMTSPSPVTDGKTVWLLTGTGVIRAFDFSGKVLWSRDLQKDYGKFGLNHGYGSSPLFLDGDLVVQVLHGMNTDDPSYVLRIDGKSGQTKWKVERPTDAIRESPDSYTTPVAVRQGKTVEVVVTGGDIVTGHDPATGKELWRSRGLNPDNNQFYRIIASPLAVDGMVFAPTRIKPMLALRIGGRGDVTDTHRAWSFDKGPDVPTPVSDGKYLYIVDDKGVVHCLDVKTGAIVYGPERLKPGTYSSSPVLAGDRIYISNEDGLTMVFKAGPAFEVLAENPLEDYQLGSVATSDGQVFIRTAKHLYAIGARTKAVSANDAKKPAAAKKSGAKTAS